MSNPYESPRRETQTGAGRRRVFLWLAVVAIVLMLLSFVTGIAMFTLVAPHPANVPVAPAPTTGTETILPAEAPETAEVRTAEDTLGEAEQ
jgi:hypothetical protein